VISIRDFIVQENCISTFLNGRPVFVGRSSLASTIEAEDVAVPKLNDYPQVGSSCRKNLSVVRLEVTIREKVSQTHGYSYCLY